jgi:hypothetical protein
MSISYEEALADYFNLNFRDGINRSWVPFETQSGFIYFVSKDDNLICFVPPYIQALRKH